MLALDFCKNPGDGCGIPDDLCTATAENPLLGEPTRVLGATGANGINSANPPLGSTAPALNYTITQPSVSSLAQGFSQLATAMTGKTFDPNSFVPGLQANLSTRRWTYGFAGNGVAFGYDPSKGKARMRVLSFEDKPDAVGEPTVISPAGASLVIEEWLSNMSMAGMPPAKYWSIKSPLITEVTERDGDRTRLLAYVYTIFRQVNGFPVQDRSLTIWVHRTGAVMYVETYGSDGLNVVGPPGLEKTPSFSLIKVPRSTAQEHLVNWGHAQWPGATVETKGAWTGYRLASAVCEGDTCDRDYVLAHFVALQPTTDEAIGRITIAAIDANDDSMSVIVNP